MKRWPWAAQVNSAADDAEVAEYQRALRELDENFAIITDSLSEARREAGMRRTSLDPVSVLGRYRFVTVGSDRLVSHTTTQDSIEVTVLLDESSGSFLNRFFARRHETIRVSIDDENVYLGQALPVTLVVPVPAVGFLLTVEKAKSSSFWNSVGQLEPGMRVLIGRTLYYPGVDHSPPLEIGIRRSPLDPR